MRYIVLLAITLLNWNIINTCSDVLDIKQPDKHLTKMIDKTDDPVKMIPEVRKHLRRYEPYDKINTEITLMLLRIETLPKDNQKLLLELLSSI